MGLSKIESIATFLMTLIIMWPICSADVMGASSVTQVSATGVDGIDSIVRGLDTLSVTAKVKITGDSSISATQVLLGTTPFNSCTAIDSTSSQCIYTDSSQRSFSGSGAKNVLVVAKDDLGATVASGTGVYYADETAPMISTFSVTEDATTKQATLAYSVVDIAQAGASSSMCSGIKMLTMYIDTVAIKTIAGNGKCSMSGSEVLSSSLFSTAGDLKICLEADDYFDQKSAQTCTNYQYDTGAPLFDETSLYISKNGGALQYVGAGMNVVFDLEMDIADDSKKVIPDSKIWIDTSKVGGTSKKKPSSCSFSSGVNSCTWSNLQVYVPSVSDDSTTTLPITFYAEDDKANKGNHSVDLANYLKVDSTAPSVTQIGSLYTDDDGNYYLGAEENQIWAQIDETESGIDVGDISISGAASGSPDECFLGSGCYWNFTGVTGTDGKKVKATISSSSKDMAGNLITGTLEQSFIVDKNKPKLLNATFANEENLACTWSPKNTSACKADSFFRDGDKLLVLAVIEEMASTPIVYLNASDIIDENRSYVGTCEERLDSDDLETGIWDCYWSDIGPVEYNLGGKVEITVYDSAGNHIDQDISVKIFKKAKDREYWSTIVLDEMMPEKLDRKIAQAVSQSAYLKIKLVPGEDASSDMKVRAIELYGCDDEQNQSAFRDYRDVEAETDTGDMRWQRFEFNPFDSKIDDTKMLENLTLNCEYTIITQVGSSLSKPQRINATFEIGLYNLPMGFIDDSVQKEIDELMENVKDGSTFDDMRTLGQVMAVWSNICGLMTLINAVIALWGSVTDVLACLGILACVSSAASTASGKALTAFSQVEQTGWRTAMEWICTIPTCTLQEKLLEKFSPNTYKWIKNPIGEGIKTTDPNTKQKVTLSQYFENNVYSSSTSKKTKIVDDGKKKETVNYEQQRKVVFDPTKEIGGFMDSSAIRKNKVLSYAFLCAPGISDFYVKQGEAACKKISCLKDRVPYGTPKEVCDEIYDYDMCMLTNQQYTSLLELVPFTKLFDLVGQIIGLVGCAFGIGDSDQNGYCVAQLGIIGASIGCFMAGCGGCAECGLCTACYLLTMYDMTSSVISMVERMFKDNIFSEDYWLPNNTPYCDALLENNEDEDNTATGGGSM